DGDRPRAARPRIRPVFSLQRVNIPLVLSPKTARNSGFPGPCPDAGRRRAQSLRTPVGGQARRRLAARTPAATQRGQPMPKLRLEPTERRPGTGAPPEGCFAPSIRSFQKRSPFPEGSHSIEPTLQT